MKSNESHDVARNPVDLSCATAEEPAPNTTEAHENKRRRLIRGAVAYAPLLLTLRTGVSAAVSCTGAKALNVPVGQNNKPDASAGAVSGDVCFEMDQVNICPTAASKLENGPGSPAIGYTIGSDGKCGPLQNTTVAILSATSAASFVV